MIYHPHEQIDYQEFLSSSEREAIVPAEVYYNLIPKEKKIMRLLDFGCGLGYVSTLLHKKFSSSMQLKIYGCDYQEDLLDSFWQKIANKQIEGITPFFMPNQSRLYFPKWLPVLDAIIFSFSLSALDSPREVLHSLRPYLGDRTQIHIIDWKSNIKSDIINQFIPEHHRIHLENFYSIISDENYAVIEEQSKTENYFRLHLKAN